MNAIVCTLGDVVKGTPALGRLREEKLAIKVSLDVRRISAVLDAEYEIYIEAEKELLDRHGQKNDEGDFVRPPVLDEAGSIMVNKDGAPILDETRIQLIDKPMFQEDMDTLFSVDLELMIKPLQLSGISHLKISPNDLDALFFLIEDDITVSE